MALSQIFPEDYVQTSHNQALRVIFTQPEPYMEPGIGLIVEQDGKEQPTIWLTGQELARFFKQLDKARRRVNTARRARR